MRPGPAPINALKPAGCPETEMHKMLQATLKVFMKLEPDYSHIYIEHDALDYPDSQRVLERFTAARVVPVDHYKDVFNRPNQDWRRQKNSQNLILAVRRDNFLYEGSDIVQDFGYPNFYYNALVLNCLYDCDYCYLQGMFPSAHVVLFVNNEDYFHHTDRLLDHKPLYLAISYDTDLLAFEHILPYCSRWLRFAAARQDLTIELRTKSANYRAIRQETPSPNCILAWTLSPDSVISQYEKKTPPLASRLRAASRAQQDGWPIRLSFDPVLCFPGWQDAYRSLVRQTFERIDPQGVNDISVGVFRMSKDYLRRIRGQRNDSDVLYYPYETGNGIVSYPEHLKTRMIDFISRELAAYLPDEKLIT